MSNLRSGRVGREDIVIISQTGGEEQGEVAAGLLEPCQAADVWMGVSLSGLQACVACTKGNAMQSSSCAMPNITAKMADQSKKNVIKMPKFKNKIPKSH